MISCAARAGWTADNYVDPRLGEGAGTLVTDRPGFSFRTETVAPWHLVLDLGYDYTHAWRGAGTPPDGVADSGTETTTPPRDEGKPRRAEPPPHAGVAPPPLESTLARRDCSS